MPSLYQKKCAECNFTYDDIVDQARLLTARKAATEADVLRLLAPVKGDPAAEYTEGRLTNLVGPVRVGGKWEPVHRHYEGENITVTNQKVNDSLAAVKWFAELCGLDLTSRSNLNILFATLLKEEELTGDSSAVGAYKFMFDFGLVADDIYDQIRAGTVTAVASGGASGGALTKYAAKK